MTARAFFCSMLAGLLLLLASCGEIGLQRLPTPTNAPEPAYLFETPLPGETPAPALLERRRFVLEWPRRILEKDSGLIVLSLQMDEDGQITPTVQTSNGAVVGETFTIPNLYDTHNVVAVARLDLAGMEAYRESMREPLRPGREVTFRWSIRADEAGVYRGVVWLQLELVPRDGGSVDQLTLLARTIEVEAVTVLGLSGTMARGLGAVGLVISTILGYPFLQRMFDTLWKRRTGGSPKPSGERLPEPQQGQQTAQPEEQRDDSSAGHPPA